MQRKSKGNYRAPNGGKRLKKKGESTWKIRRRNGVGFAGNVGGGRVVIVADAFEKATRSKGGGGEGRNTGNCSGKNEG